MLVSGAVPVVGASEVGGGAVSAAAAAVGLLLSWRHFGNRRRLSADLNAGTGEGAVKESKRKLRRGPPQLTDFFLVGPVPNFFLW